MMTAAATAALDHSLTRIPKVHELTKQEYDNSRFGIFGHTPYDIC